MTSSQLIAMVRLFLPVFIDYVLHPYLSSALLTFSDCAVIERQSAPTTAVANDAAAASMADMLRTLKQQVRSQFLYS
jgi:hypothetical protein